MSTRWWARVWRLRFSFKGSRRTFKTHEASTVTLVLEILVRVQMQKPRCREWWVAHGTSHYSPLYQATSWLTFNLRVSSDALAIQEASPGRTGGQIGVLNPPCGFSVGHPRPWANSPRRRGPYYVSLPKLIFKAFMGIFQPFQWILHFFSHIYQRTLTHMHIYLRLSWQFLSLYSKCYLSSPIHT